MTSHPCITCSAPAPGKRKNCPDCAALPRRQRARHRAENSQPHNNPTGFGGLLAVRLEPESFATLFARSKALGAAKVALDVLRSSRAPTVRRARRR